MHAVAQPSTKTSHPLSVARERLFRLGVEALSDKELFALVGTSETLDLPSALSTHPRELASHIGDAPASRFAASVELGRRALRARDTRPTLKTPAEIHAYLAPSLASLPREVFHVLCLNVRNTLIADVRVGEGNAHSCPVDSREVFAAAITHRAAGIVLAHNHPSGDPEPSSMDISLTRQLVSAANLFSLPILDHVIVGAGGRYTSLRERGLVLPANSTELAVNGRR